MTRTPPIAALTICQPWAWAIAEGHKAVENREWPTRYRGPLAIHAGLSHKWIDEGREALAAAAERHARPEWQMPPLDQLTFGAVVAVVDVIGCRSLRDLADETRKAPISYGLYRSAQLRAFAGGPFCWLLNNVRKLRDPIPCRGLQGLWHLPPDVQAALTTAQTISAATPSA